ncbi:MAG: oligosaccharide flippase family protein, partial [Flavobacteriaceae bacterium]|nr:oligosaccharide flippase family protein [Flavobacteriaceae bacterium]
MLKITSVNSLAVGIRMIIAFVSQKLIAIFLRQEGVAILGNLRNIIPMIESFATLGIFNGVVKYVAELKDDKKELQKLFSTAFAFGLSASIISFIVLFFGAEKINILVFGKDQSFEFIFKILSVSVPFIALNRVFNGIVNGLSAYKKFAKINIISYFFSTIFLLFSAYYKNIEGALIAIALI